MAENEGARKSGKFLAVSLTPDVCKTPVGNAVVPVPYPITANLSDSMSTSPNVNFGGDPAFILSKSTVTRVTGDEAGTAGGVKSGVNKAKVKPVKGSSSVRINGTPVIRHGDPCDMNNGNTTGKIIYQGLGKSASKNGSSDPPVEPETPEEKKTMDDQSAGNNKKQINTNKENGEAFARKKTEEFKKRADNVENEITVKTEGGTKTRLDAIGYDKKTGEMTIQEYKASQTAPLTKNQKKGFPEIESSGAEIVGKGKGEFSGGKTIPPTKIEIIRPIGEG
jgi:uncharacterized Zn-binding protein involved in type VI secretion